MDNWVTVSVESRKGGVGKTTAALNLARLFQKRQHAVLFLDVDMTGTNAVDALELTLLERHHACRSSCR